MNIPEEFITTKVERTGHRTKVTVTHTVTGISASSSAHKSQYQNKRAAMKKLEEAHGGPQIPDMMRDLLGCEWGRALKTPDDQDECENRATHMTTVHNGPAQRTFKLCDKHEERLQMETTPRGEGG